MKSSLLAILLASSAYGHIQMSKPYPIRSPLNPNGGDNKDYSYTNPLATDGSDYPCKGYQNDAFSSVATYSPGQEYDLELSGSATHGGGSCQIALSYDKGETFQVIHSILGGCPLTLNYKFTVPSDAPSGEALLAWTWFNKVGNREMYMNCAQVTIGGSSQRQQSSFKTISRRQAFSSLPPVFEANVNGPGQCKTVEGQEVNFPAPGPSVEGSLSGKGYTCASSAPFLVANSSNAPNSPVESSILSYPSSAQHAPAATTSSSKSSSSLAGVASVATTPSSMVPSPFGDLPLSSSFPSLPVNAQPTVQPYASTDDEDDDDEDEVEVDDEEEPCVPGTIICAEDGLGWWLCSEGIPVHMGNVAAGMQCRHGAMQRVE